MAASDSAHFPLTRHDSTFVLELAGGRLEIIVCTPRIVRVRFVRDGQAGEPSYVEPRDWPLVPVDLHAGTPAVIETGECTVRVDMNPLCLEFTDAAGRSTVQAPIADAFALEEMRRLPLTAQPEAPRHAAEDTRLRFATHFIWTGDQHFYGLGEGGKQFDRLGGTRRLWNSHLGRGPGSDLALPLLLSTHGYGLFFDNTYDATLTVGRTDGVDKIAYAAEGGTLDWYYLAGSGPREVLAAVADLLGHALMPPRWALGFLQSSRHFEHTAELMALPRTMREKSIPCDGLIFLSTYGDDMGWNRGVGHLEFQPDLIPEPATLFDDLHGRGFKLITHEYPVLHEQSPLFAEAQQAGYLLDEGYDRQLPAGRPTPNFYEGQHFIDFADAGAGAWWWARHRSLLDLGVDGWWLDGGEGPASTTRMHGGSGLALHNLYDRLRQQVFAEGEARDRPAIRPFLLCRSGAAGMARYGATCWSGDVDNSFATLEAQVSLGLNTGLSGIPYWGTDIGGFFHPLPESGELYARWFQFGAFCPGFRAHGYVWREHLPWSHGPQIESICRRYVELRYRLLPYTYTLAWQARTLGLPLMRPLVLNYTQDPSVWDLGTEYLWGDDLLVAPVTREGATAWPVYLPAGVWYDYWTQERHDGPTGLTAEAPLDRLPLFVRGGAILPLAPVAQYDGEQAWDEIALLIYPDPAQSSHFDLYEDDGCTNAYQDGHAAVTPISATLEDGRLSVRVGPPAGDASIIAADRTYTLQILAGLPRGVRLDGSLLPLHDAGLQSGRGYSHDGTFLTVRLGAREGMVIVDL